MRSIRTLAALGLAAAAAATAFSAPVAQADDCHDFGVATNCTYVDGTCIHGGGRIGDHTLYVYNVPLDCA